MLVRSPEALGTPDAVIFFGSVFIILYIVRYTFHLLNVSIAFKDRVVETNDYGIFEKLVSEFGGSSAKAQFIDQRDRGIKVIQAVNNLVDAAVNQNQISIYNAPRLKSLFSVWLKGRTSLFSLLFSSHNFLFVVCKQFAL